MTCAEVRELIDLHACGALEGAEREAVAAHLRTGCPGCAGALAASETALAHLPLGLERVEPPASVKEKLLARVAAGAAPGGAAPRGAEVVAIRPPRRVGALVPLLAAAAAVVVTLLAVQVPARRERAALRASIAARDQEIARLEERERAAAEAAAYLSAPDMVLYALAGTESQPKARARVFWDPARGRARLVASRLQPSAAGRTYELWLIEGGDAGRKIPAGTFDVDADGSGLLDLAIPADVGTLAVLAVTDEPTGGSPQPTGGIHLAGAVATKS